MDCRAITTTAYETLLRTGAAAFPIDVHELHEPDILLLSYQRYARLSKRSVADVSCGYTLPDAYLAREVRPGLKLVLYNADAIAPRMRHSLWHEVGHLRLDHSEHTLMNEREADYFAGQIAAPDVLLCDIERRGYTLTPALLGSVFGISEAAARVKLRQLARRADTACDTLVRARFAPFLDTRCPPFAARELCVGLPSIDIRKE